jgi:hypothetical protein
VSYRKSSTFRSICWPTDDMRIASRRVRWSVSNRFPVGSGTDKAIASASAPIAIKNRPFVRTAPTFPPCSQKLLRFENSHFATDARPVRPAKKADRQLFMPVRAMESAESVFKRTDRAASVGALFASS